MATFSWSDSVQAAFGSCLPCFAARSSSPEGASDSDNDNSTRIRRARPDELEGLLADVPDTDTEAETLSLYSNPGDGRRRQKKKSHKSITIFGYNLFGKPPIQLPEDDEEDDLLSNRRRRKGRSSGRNSQATTSSSTLDSDASPLDPATIDQITPAQLEERARAADEEERRAKEERRQRRRERKELKKAAQALALGGEEFEGFQGSGTYPQMPPNNLVPPEEYGPFVEGREDDSPADLDGGIYTQRKATSSTSNGSDSNSHSRTSDIRYQPSPMPLPRTKSKSKSSKSRSSTTSTSTSPSLPSPVNDSFSGLSSPQVAVASSDGSNQSENSGFPSAGFGGGRSKGRGGDMGAFLARK